MAGPDDPVDDRKLLLVVDAQHVLGGDRVHDRDAGAVRPGDAEDVGDVVLAVRVVVAGPSEPVEERAGPEAVVGGVHLPDFELPGRRVLLLDDAFEVAGRIAENASVTRWVGDLGGREGRVRRRRAMRREQRLEGLGEAWSFLLAAPDASGGYVVNPSGEAFVTCSDGRLSPTNMEK